MRGKRSKQYRKLMQQYGLAYGFREPYQVLLDADMIKDADKFKMDLVGGLERTLHGEVKPMITQCSMRHLYASASEPGIAFLIDKAKTYERRRCGHRPEEYPEPLSTAECLSSVVDPKGAKTNKNRYVIASQDLEVRKAMRAVLGVPLVYVNRSVMIMEPMAEESKGMREREERGKFRVGLKAGAGRGLKRAREDEQHPGEGEGGEEKPTKKKRKGPKEPNPLSMPKKKKAVVVEGDVKEKSTKKTDAKGEGEGTEPGEQGGKRKRKRKPKAVADGGGEEVAVAVAVEHD
ncbi:hypothetical protein LZ554_002407 [Drepanopeziza brunnea f. sp. 'monogermtubi']|nr:hypothetical protein LZ554_002407 [Drepanopeziza brunnea f. sp. 'monogermtubi']